MRVRAYLAAGIAQAAPWGIALDGLLASELWAEQKASCRAAGRGYVRALETDNPPDLDLPLARCQPKEGPWHWAATCAHPDQDHGRVDVHTWTGRVDARALEQVATGLPKTVSGRQGRYRARRMPLLVTPCSSVTWHAVGDVARVRELMEPIASIGKKRSTGEGHVLRWEVTPAPNLDELAAGHLHPDDTLGRTVPDACRRLLGEVADGGRGRRQAAMRRQAQPRPRGVRRGEGLLHVGTDPPRRRMDASAGSQDRPRPDRSGTIEATQKYSPRGSWPVTDLGVALSCRADDLLPWAQPPPASGRCREERSMRMSRTVRACGLVTALLLAALTAAFVPSAANADQPAPAAEPAVTYDWFRPGQPWLDDQRRTIQADGGQVVVSKDAAGIRSTPDGELTLTLTPTRSPNIQVSWVMVAQTG
ncbi:hypothetical protein GCM10023317_84930 [Actinopolymorpha pittospori]